jgi:uncharacterized protein YjbI with pentapeptide repeats
VLRAARLNKTNLADINLNGATLDQAWFFEHRTLA